MLAVGAVIGLVITVFSAVKATPKAEKLIFEKEKEYGEPLTKTQKAAVSIPCFIPCALSGIATAACIIGAVSCNKKKIASLTGSYALIADQYRRYTGTVKEIYGEETHRNVVERMDVVDRNSTSISACGAFQNSGFELPEHSEQLLFFDAINEIFFTAAYEEVLQALYHTNRNFFLRGGIEPLNDYYEFLGIECYSELGWKWSDGYEFIDFAIYKSVKNGKECYVIEPAFWPEGGYDDYEA